jgi:hypothetical protein
MNMRDVDEFPVCMAGIWENAIPERRSNKQQKILWYTQPSDNNGHFDNLITWFRILYIVSSKFKYLILNRFSQIQFVF